MSAGQKVGVLILGGCLAGVWGVVAQDHHRGLWSLVMVYAVVWGAAMLVVRP